MVATSQLRRVACVATLALLTALPAVARAATDAEQAEALIREGVQLRAHDKTLDALSVFEKAYQISRTPRTAAQLGLCELELGHFVAAERHLDEALAGPDHPWVRKNKPALKKSLESARAGIGELALTLTPPNAEVLVNHKPADATVPGAPLRLDKGTVDLEVRAPGYEPAHDTIAIAGGKREQRTFALVPEAKPVVALTAPPPVDTAAALATAPPPGSEHRKQRIAAWITGGAALGALMFGIVEAGIAHNKSNVFEGHTGVTAGGVVYQDCGTAQLTPACRSLKDDYDHALTLEIVGLATAGALAATSAVLFVRSSPRGPEGDRGARAFACVPDPVARGLDCTLRF